MGNRLTILFTNIWLVTRGGSETVTRDLALGMLRRGHRPIVYSPALGEAAEQLTAKGIVVIDDLRKLGEPPDILHAHHSIPCGEALIRFPQVPAIYTCHAFAYWVEAPAHFPQIAAYLAVDEACRDRLVQAEGIDPARVIVMPNAVDIARIPPRPRPLMEQPKQAIAFGKAGAVPELRMVCERLGIAFEAIGYGAGQPSAHPERELVNADLVFGSARCALESLCCGCAVIVCDARGIAGLVTSDNYEALRQRNFGLRSLGGSVTIERCVREIQRYDPADAARVSERARRDADLENRLDKLEHLYAELLGGARRPHITQEAHACATARFLHENLPRHPNDARWPWLNQREALLTHIQQLEIRLSETSRLIGEIQQAGDKDRISLEEELAETARAAEKAQLVMAAELVEAVRRGEEMHRALETKLAALLDDAARMQQQLEEKLTETAFAAETAQLARAAELAETARRGEETGRALETKLAASLERAARTQQQLEESRSDFLIVSTQIADLRRSRMLKLGRVFRRIMGRPVEY